MTVRFYRSTDAGAPQNTNAAGSLIAILDACLVNGYGSQLPAGWTKPFSGTNKAGYKQGAGSSGFYLRVEDTTTSAARVKGCEDMTGIDTTVSDFPTNVQFSGGLYMQKNNSAAAYQWELIANEKFFTLLIAHTSDNNRRQLMCFGDIVSNKSGDAFNTILIAPTQASTSDLVTSYLQANLMGSYQGHFLVRPHTQVGSAVNVSKMSVGTQSALGGSNGIAYPSPIDGALHLAPIFITEPNAGLRGKLPCVWNILHNAPFQQGDIITGTGDFAGKTFLASNTGYTAGYQALFEISDTW